MDFFVSTLLALFQAEAKMPNNVSKHRWIPVNVIRVSVAITYYMYNVYAYVRIYKYT